MKHKHNKIVIQYNATIQPPFFTSLKYCIVLKAIFCCGSWSNEYIIKPIPACTRVIPKLGQPVCLAQLVVMEPIVSVL